MASNLWKRVDLMVNGRLPLAVYTSLRTGLRFAIGDVPGPMVKSCVSLVTETTTDDGLPHTLEHLVFMGSEKYPFKGFLDVISNRCFASGTNAWTDTDHTAYTMDTVGAEGFYKSFPVYLNHILRPTLTVEQYVTEVHHINEKGEDAGVVYCEMQDHESEADSILARRAAKLLFPMNHPYSVETGGTLPAIRELCSVDRVRAFHKKFYHIGNVFAIVCGKVDPMRVQRIMEELESAEMERIPADFPKPFSTPVPPLSSSVVEFVTCPSDDDSHGSALISWLGPSSRDVHTCEALDILFTYLTDTAVSPFHKNFIDIPDPLASSASFHLSEQSTGDISLSLGGVPAQRLSDILPVLERVMKEHQNAAAFDASRMGFVCQQALLHAHAKLETSPARTVWGSLITHQLYGEKSEDDLLARMNDTAIIEQLSQEKMQYWAELVTRYFSAPSIALLGQPSADYSEKQAAAEEARVVAQKEKFGKEGLAKCADAHCKAVQANTSAKPPSAILDELMVNELEDFRRFNIEIHHTEDAAREDKSPEIRALLNSFPFPATLHHSSDTKFVELWLSMDTASLTEEQRRLLLVFFELPFESPAIVDGVEKTPEEVCCLFTRDLLDHSLHSGYSNAFDRAAVLWLKVDAGRIDNLVKWSEVFLKTIRIDPERVKTIATRLAGEAREHKRDGYYVCQTAMRAVNCRKDSNSYMLSQLVLQKVHESLAKECTRDPAAVIDKFEKLRSALLSKGMNAHLLCDATAVKAPPSSAWKWVEEEREKHGLKGAAIARFEYPAGEDAEKGYGGKQILVPLGSCESSFLAQSVPYKIEWESPLLAPLMILTQYFSQCEGPLWKGVRGNGLAYGVWVSVNVDEQALSLGIYRSSNVTEAYAKVEEIVREELSRASLDETQLEGAKRSLICDLHTRAATVSSAGSRSVLSCLQLKEPAFLKSFSQRVWDCPLDAVKEAGPTVLQLFQQGSFGRAVTTHTRQIADVKKAFPAIATLKIEAVPLNA